MSPVGAYVSSDKPTRATAEQGLERTSIILSGINPKSNLSPRVSGLIQQIFPIPRVGSVGIGSHLAFLKGEPHKSNEIDGRGDQQVEGILPIQSNVVKPLNGRSK